jgi:hypothetical protein
VSQPAVISVFPREISKKRWRSMIHACARESIGRTTSEAAMRVACPIVSNVRIFKGFCVQRLHAK